MCMRSSAVRPYQRWRWAGDEIVHSPVIPAARRIAGRRKRGYPIDIRAYLSTDSNAVIHDWLRALVQALSPNDQLRFYGRGEGCFDFRAHVVAQGFQTLRYLKSDRTFDQWLFPEETLHQGGGDCEDLAFVLAALLAAAGISWDCIRVALGRLVNHSAVDAPPAWDHVWVMYQQENSAWRILEPVAQVHRPRGSAAAPRRHAPDPDLDLEYLPCFVFNAHHLWRVRGPERRAAGSLVDYLGSRLANFWSEFDPSFAAGVHNDVFDQALAGMPELDRLVIKAASLGVDADVLRYDPRDHFDFAYIPEGWARVQARLATGRLQDFGLAAHAIADFYAHSLYGYLARNRVTNGRLPLYDPAQPLPAEEMDYSFLAHLDRPGCTGSPEAFETLWNGKLISGQWWRWYTTYPDELEPELGFRRCLPDHDALAVDSPRPVPSNPLFDPTEQQIQFALRRQAAIEHIAAVHNQWKRA